MSITAYPLTWPALFPRTPERDRKSANFGCKNRDGYGIKRLSVPAGRDRVLQALSAYTRVGHSHRCAPDSVVISTQLRVRKADGLPAGGQREPEDPGVCVYYELDGVLRHIPCDTYDRVADNLAAVAATIEALRTIERHGTQLFEGAYTGFTPLPSPDHVIARSWRDVLGYYGNDLAEAEHIYKGLRGKAHPDRGGSVGQMQELQEAIKQAREGLVPQVKVG